MRLKKFHSIINNTSEEMKDDIKLSMDILDRINQLLNEKFDGKQKLLAAKMNKTEAEVSKWLNGVQNFTTKTLNKLQIAFGEPIIVVYKNGNTHTAKTSIPSTKQKFDEYFTSDFIETCGGISFDNYVWMVNSNSEAIVNSEETVINNG